VLGEDDRAAELYPLVKEPLENVKIGLFGSLMPETAAGIVAACSRSWDAAEAHFRTALGYAREIPHKLEEPQIRYWYAKMLIERKHVGRLREGSRASQRCHRRLPQHRHATTHGDGQGTGGEALALEQAMSRLKKGPAWVQNPTPPRCRCSAAIPTLSPRNSKRPECAKHPARQSRVVQPICQEKGVHKRYDSIQELEKPTDFPVPNLRCGWRRCKIGR